MLSQIGFSIYRYTFVQPISVRSGFFSTLRYEQQQQVKAALKVKSISQKAALKLKVSLIILIYI